MRGKGLACLRPGSEPKYLLLGAAGAGTPDFMANVPQNPTIDDFVNAYKPLDAAINHAFEARITKNNARSTQYELAIVRGPLRTRPACCFFPDIIQ